MQAKANTEVDGSIPQPDDMTLTWTGKHSDLSQDLRQAAHGALVVQTKCHELPPVLGKGQPWQDRMPEKAVLTEREKPQCGMHDQCSALQDTDERIACRSAGSGRVVCA